MARQLSLLSATVQAPAVEDLEGLLCGPGHVVRRGDAARLSVVVPGGWRVAPLLAGLVALELAGDAVAVGGQRPPYGGAPYGGVPAAGTGMVSVRTAFDPRLVPVAARWFAGARLVAPAGLHLDGGRLRWWVLAAGRPDRLGYRLAVGPNAEPVWPAVGAALAAAGLPATFLGPRADGPAYRLVGGRRLARLRELVGEPPEGVPPGAWPAS
ncbi:MAG TPA: hypothetical protein VJ698_12990 [Noviherbaspirillum sp.]|uniref:hypothetical protein n=1 Tax=Noviherbaspirillum sp. TaxID=1926288 RepID=UPI002B462839|nr:hypothetical protein [Noviherbaspirillum sp.]HJV86383.1 hypothetical protein [Noviherbaspirillum sp.]